MIEPDALTEFVADLLRTIVVLGLYAGVASIAAVVFFCLWWWG